MRSRVALSIAALFAIVVTAQAGVDVESREVSSAQLLLARASHESLYTWSSRPKHDEAAGEHATLPAKSRRHTQ
jgi:hypothetical protein